jgi:tetratricopeptide (TPR) repeat protein
MTKTVVKLATLAVGATLVLAYSVPPVFADGGGGSAPVGSNTGPVNSGNSDASATKGTTTTTTPTKGRTTSTKSKGKQSEFLDGYRRAYTTIYDKHDYKAAIAQLRALKHDNQPDVANLIGYSNRKLGNYEESKVWYEAALKADPTHVRTWQYYGLWQLEQGNQAQAQVHLDKIASICGMSCPQYISLAEAMGTVAAGGRPVY